MADGLSAREREQIDGRIQRVLARPARPSVITRRLDAQPALLSFPQTRLWFFDQLMPGNPLYNISFTAHLHFTLNVPVFKQALQYLVSRHEVLRTVFTSGDEPVQVVRPTMAVPI